MNEDVHHILFTRRHYDMYSEGSRLRETPSLKVTMPRELHNEIHRNTPSNGILGRYMLLGTVKNFEPSRDTLETVDNLCFAIQEAGKSPKMHSIDRQLGALTIEAVRLQLPYLREVL